MGAGSVGSYKAWVERLYEEESAPWDTGEPCSEVVRRLASARVPASGRALDIGCGSGTQSVLLVEHGLDVVGVDLSPAAIRLAQQRFRSRSAKQHGRFICGDITELRDIGEPFDVILDRGCYHDARLNDLAGYQKALGHLTRRGTIMVVLAFNADETPKYPQIVCLSEEERTELGGIFDIADLRPIRLDVPRGSQSELLFWSALLRRR